MESKEGGDFWSRLARKLRRRYRLAISDAETFQEFWGVRLSRLNLLVALGALFAILLVLSFFAISYTPLRGLIPMARNAGADRMVVANALRVDSLSREMDLWKNYLANLRIIFSGGVPDPYTAGGDTISGGNTSFDTMVPSSGDSLLRQQVERNLQSARMRNGEEGNTGKITLRRPVEGEVTRSINAGRGHFGTDIVAAAESAIVSVADGTVILAQWSSDFGYIIAVQHKEGLLSVYKHNSRLLRQVNDRVRSGDALAIIGGEGKTSMGVHLHIELWKDGQLLNPEHYFQY